MTIFAPLTGAVHGARLRRFARWLVAGVLPLMCAAVPLWAIAGTASSLQVVQDATRRIQTAIKENKADIDRDEGRLFSLISDIVLPHFDFQRMSMWTLGPYWRSATPEQRERFVAQFRQLLVRTYGHTLIDYRDAKISYDPLLAPADARQVYVRCKVELPGRNPVQLAYGMYRTRDGWKVYDVLVEGINLVTNYRSSFAEIIQRQGMDGLIRRLADKNQAFGHD
jgi:phospholipid transport system substrate-binding protein